MNKTIRQALIDAILTTDYIIVVASLIIYLGARMPKADPAIMPIAMLLLLVFSAALTGILVFGKPLMLYLDGNKKDAVRLVAYTLAFLFIITILAFIFMISYFG